MDVLFEREYRIKVVRFDVEDYDDPEQDGKKYSATASEVDDTLDLEVTATGPTSAIASRNAIDLLVKEKADKISAKYA